MPTVMLVDDEPSIRFLQRLELEERGLDVDEADGADELLRRHAATPAWQAIVLDQRMPGMTGLEAARVLRDRGDRTPIVLYTGYLDPTVEREALALGLTTVDKADIDGLLRAVLAQAAPAAIARSSDSVTSSSPR